MAKNIDMTRARKCALPVILEAAQSYLNSLPTSDKRRHALAQALETFK